jgi:hypothetical protein
MNYLKNNIFFHSIDFPYLKEYSSPMADMNDVSQFVDQKLAEAKVKDPSGTPLDHALLALHATASQFFDTKTVQQSNVVKAEMRLKGLIHKIGTLG